jgi:hypothetical protein
VNQAAIIDGFHAVNGIIHTAYNGILTAPPGSSPSPFEIILESPQHAPSICSARPSSSRSPRFFATTAA